jgi:hypothetical protein
MMKSDITKITVTKCPDDYLDDTLNGEQMLTLYRALICLYPDAEITVGITSGMSCAYADGGDDMDNELFLKVIEVHGGWI